MTAPDDLPALAESAPLPANYEAAKAALAACDSIDECQDWADKAAALASYARAADDDTLMQMAMRIKDRAVRRAGELLKQIDGKGRNQYSEDSGDAPTTQRQAAEQAGMSKDQQVQAVRVANVPQAEFDAQVESEQPPTITALAKQGTNKRPTISVWPTDNTRPPIRYPPPAARDPAQESMTVVLNSADSRRSRATEFMGDLCFRYRHTATKPFNRKEAVDDVVAFLLTRSSRVFADAEEALQFCAEILSELKDRKRTPPVKPVKPDLRVVETTEAAP